MTGSGTPDRMRERIRDSFARQSFMQLLGAELQRIDEGSVEIAVTRRPDLLQQHGYLHAGVITAILDSACGYAALTVMEDDAAVLSVEFKTNLIAPAAGERFRVTGTVLKAGRTLVICRGEAYAEAEGRPRLIAAMQATMMSVRGRDGVRD
jgi:uncharacterized protein (TIGR00369 family)